MTAARAAACLTVRLRPVFGFWGLLPLVLVVAINSPLSHLVIQCGVLSDRLDDIPRTTVTERGTGRNNTPGTHHRTTVTERE